MHERELSKFYETVVCAVENIVSEIIKHEAIELVDVKYRKESHGWVLRVLIDKTGGVTIDDCSKTSRQLQDILDVKEVIPYAYMLEVSSPGLNRPLTQERDFKKFIGEKACIKTRDFIEDRRNFVGKLLDFKDNSIVLDVDGKIFVIPHQMVKKANLEYDYKKKRGNKCFQS